MTHLHDRTSRNEQSALRSICLALVPIAMACASAAHGALVISPSTIDNNFMGSIDLTISGLAVAGQSVRVDEYLDSDGNGIVGGDDLLIRSVVVTDGQVTVIGGQRNLNIPGDEDQIANQVIHTRLTSRLGDTTRLISGVHLFRVVATTGPSIGPFDATLNVTQANYGGSGIAGQVVDSTTNAAQPFSFVIFLSGTVGNHSVKGMALTDSSGNFSFHLAPGTYICVAGKSGYLYNLGSAPQVVVAPGAFTSNQTVALTPSQRTIAGTVRDSVSLQGVPAVPMFGGHPHDEDFVSLTFSGASGNFVMDASSEPWQIEPEPSAIAVHGLIRTESVETSSGSVTGFILDLPRATSLIYGKLKRPDGTPLQFEFVEAQTNGLPELKTGAISDEDGNFTLGVVPGAWRFQFDLDGYLTQQLTVVVSNKGQAVQQDVVAHPITAHIRGQVRDNLGNPVGGLGIVAHDYAVSSYTTTDDNGFFDLGVYGNGGTTPKTWEVAISQSSEGGSGEYLSTHPTVDVQDGVDIEGFVYVAYIVTAHLRGHVLDENDDPIGNINIWASKQPDGYLSSGDVVAADGSFDIPVAGGNWHLGLSNISGLNIIPQDMNVAVVDGVDQNNIVFRAFNGTSTIVGSVQSTLGAPIVGVGVYGVATNGGNTYSSYGSTDSSGNYSMPVFSGLWSVGVDSSGLQAQGYMPVNSQPVFVSAGTVIANFVATPSSVPADLNGDGSVNGADLAIVLGNWGNSGVGDLTGDGTVDGADLGVLLGAWST